MVNIKWVALIFRLAAIALTVLALLTNTGLYWVDWRYLTPAAVLVPLTYWTTLSNVFVLVTFMALTVYTIRSFWDRDKTDVCFFPRLQGYIVVFIALNFFVSNTLLLRDYTFAELLLYRNNGVHIVVPLLMFTDYFLFCNGGHLKKHDPYILLIMPNLYMIFAFTYGLCGGVYHYAGGTRKAPYWFLDYEEQGWMVAVYYVIILIFYVGFGKMLYFIDQRRKTGLYDKAVGFFFGGRQ